MTKVIFTTSNDLSTIGGRIKFAMERKGMSQADLMRAIGIKSSSMSNLINNTRTKRPSATTLLRLADVLDVSQEWIMTGKGEPDDKRVLVSDAEIHKDLDKLPADKKQAIHAAIQAFLLTDNTSL